MLRYLKSPAPLSALLALALYAITLGGVFIYDDVAVILKDKRIADPTRWGQYWTDSYNFGVDNLYRPIVSMSYAFQYFLHGPRPLLFHAVNWLLHAAASALVAQFAIRLAERCAFEPRRARAIGLVAGLLFAAHSIHVEAVANVVGRAELMCAVGVLGALLLFLRPLTPGSVAGIYGCFVLALLSKEQGMLVPLLLGVLALVLAGPAAVWKKVKNRKPHSPNPPSGQNLSAVLFLLLALTLAGYVAYRESILKFWWDKNFLDTWIQPLAAPEVTLTDRLLVPITIAGRYFQLLLAPVVLRLDYGGTIVPGRFDPSDPYFYAGLGAVGLWIAWLVVAIKRRDQFSIFCLVSFAFLYGLLGNVVTIIGVNMAERLMYLPSAFFLLLIARAVTALPRRVCAVLIAIAVSALSLRSITYARHWNDKLGFYLYAARVEPRSVKAVQLATLELLDAGRLEDAEASARRAIALRPDSDDVYLQLARVLIQQHRWDEAQAAIGAAEKRNPAGAWGFYQTQLDAAQNASLGNNK